MRSKDDLFHLIKAMSKSEKRYFVLDAKKAGGEASRYHALFDALNDLEKYDEKADAWLKKKFPKNLSADKAYLYESILRSMRDYRSPSSKAAQVKERLMDARYLHERGLYEQSTDRIMEAKSMAKELQDEFALLEINKEEHLSLFDRKALAQLEHIEVLNSERKANLEAIQEEMKYHDLYYRLGLEILKESSLKDEQSIQSLKERLPIHLMNSENRPISSKAIHRYYLCKAVYHNLLGELEQVQHYYLEAAKWWDNYPIVKEEEFHRYIINVLNLVNTSFKMEKYIPVAYEWIEKLKNEEPSQIYHNQKMIFRTLSISNLLHLLNRNDFQKAHKLLPEILDGLKKFGLEKSIALMGNIVTVYFLVKDYQNCIKCADYIDQNLKESGREDIKRIIKIYKIISLYESGNIDKVESESRSVQRLFKSKGLKKERFEEMVLNVYLRKVFTLPVSEVKSALFEFKNYLQMAKHSPQTENTLGIDELLIWINHKVK